MTPEFWQLTIEKKGLYTYLLKTCLILTLGPTRHCYNRAGQLQCFPVQDIKREQNEFIGNGELGVGQGLSY